MKKFIMLSYTIARMGGGQMYQYNKLKYMKKQGYETYVFYSIPGKIVIKDIEKIAHCQCIEELNINPCIVSKKEVSNVKKIIKESLKSSDDDICVIEACNKPTSLWGEIIAKECRGVCFPFIIDEKIGSLDDKMKDYFYYKRNKDELKGIKKETYEMIFESDCDKDGYKYCLPISGNNVVQDIDINEEYENIDDFEGVKICTIGNLNKEYVMELLRQVIEYSEKWSNEKILYCMIGDSPNSDDIKRIEELFMNKKNIQLCLMGAMYPIPEKLLYKFDAFVSSAGSARVSGDRGIPTITIDSRDYMSIGIYQAETENTVFRNNEPMIPISKKLKDMMENYEEIRSKLYVKPQTDFDGPFHKHLEYYEKHANTGEYYDILTMRLSKEKLIEKLIYLTMGRKTYEKIRMKIFYKM